VIFQSFLFTRGYFLLNPIKPPFKKKKLIKPPFKKKLVKPPFSHGTSHFPLLPGHNLGAKSPKPRDATGDVADALPQTFAGLLGGGTGQGGLKPPKIIANCGRKKSISAEIGI
jgi:hypothetical protein